MVRLNYSFRIKQRKSCKHISVFKHYLYNIIDALPLFCCLKLNSVAAQSFELGVVFRGGGTFFCLNCTEHKSETGFEFPSLTKPEAKL